MKAQRRLPNHVQRFDPDNIEWLKKPVIPVFSDPSGHEALLANASVLFLQGIALPDLSGGLKQLDNPILAHTPVFVHIDLLEGLNADKAGLRYLSKFSQIDGIITVRPYLIPLARQLGLKTVLRMFLQDSRAVERGVSVSNNQKPDAIELLPGVAAIEACNAFDALPVPRLAGGLIHSEQTVKRILASGCRSISTTDPKLWAMNLTCPP